MAQAPHPISLRVLRALRPSLWPVSDVPYAESSKAALQREQDFAAPIQPSLGISSLYQLPQSFGELHLGESFRAAVVLAHDGISDEVALRPSLRLEIDAPSRQKVFLSETGGQTTELQPGQCIETMSEYEIKEAGPHALVCTVSYEISGSAEPRTFRKLFRFNVTNPLSVRTKVHGVTSDIGLLSPERETSYLEVQISNTAPPPSLLHFERIAFEPAEGMSATPAAGGSLDPFSLEAGTVHQHLLILKPLQKPPSEAFAKAKEAGTLPLGRLDLNWRTAGGEPGRLQTSMLVRRMAGAAQAGPAPQLTYTPRSPARSPQLGRLSSPPLPDVSLAVLSYPARTQSEKPFTVRVKLQGPGKLEGFHPPLPVTTQMASLLAAEAAGPADLHHTLFLGCQAIDTSGEWETKWLPTAPPGSIVDVGGLRVVDDRGRTLREWSTICQTWLVEQASL